MKTLKIFSLAVVCAALTLTATAQTKTETFKVSGNCGMCKSKIEKAAKDGGATAAKWDVDSKIITVTYKSSTTNTAKIQQNIAAAGYDNAGLKATEESYKKLHACCQYDRDEAAAAVSEEHHNASHTMKADCCKDGKCTKPGHTGKDCCSKDGEKMDCCKDGKCTKEGHTGGDCCKKS
jgi:periplasmic mercuric ion binding protein